MAGEKVLIVENTVYPDAKALEKMLRANAYEVIGIAENVEEAVSQAKKGKPDVVLMDIKIPLSPGGEEDIEGGIKAAKQIQLERETCIIYLTCYESEDVLQKVHRASPSAPFLTKPCLELQLIATVKLVLMKRRGKKVIFLCYAREDMEIKDELLMFLEALDGFGIEAWDDSKIKFGDRWQVEVSSAVERADIAIVLVSIHMLRSRYIREFELPKLLELAGRRGLKAIPAYVASVPDDPLFKSGLSEFQAINEPSDPLSGLSREVRATKYWTPLCNQLVRG